MRRAMSDRPRPGRKGESHAGATMAPRLIRAMILRHEFTPLDNRRLARLCGPTDAHLRTIEAALDVRIARREAAFRIEGAKARAEQGLAVLRELYERASRSLDAQAVDLALAGTKNAAARI